MNVFVSDTLQDLEEKGLRRELRTVESAQGREVVIDGKRFLNFCSNNYLGLADDERLKKAAAACLEEQGLGAGASRLVCGNLSAHRVLEEEIARFKGTEASLVFSTGYMANVGIIASLFGAGDMIFSDRLNHASIIDGILLSQAKWKRYPHCDMDALEAMLQKAQGYRQKVIVTDTVFSMDGDIAPLDKIVALAKKYDCLVMVDEAHALGVLGENGKGVVEYFGLQDQVDIQMGTFSKAVGSFGAYCCGRKMLIECLVNKARSFIYTTGLPPSIAAASCEGIRIIEDDQQRRQQLWENTRYFVKRVKEMGFETLNTETPIVPIVVKEAELAVQFSKVLYEQGLFVAAIRPPTVPQGTSRLRVTIMATHTQEDLDRLLAALSAMKI